MDILRDINKKEGVTILCNLHLPELAREYGDRILALKNGQMIYDGGAENLDQKMAEKIYGTI